MALFLSCSFLHGKESGRVVVLGDSLTAGYGIDPSQAFPALLQEKIDENGLAYEVVNAGISGDTSASGLRRVDWVLQKPADVLILELGANDGLRGISLDSTRGNLQGIIDRARSHNRDLDILIAGMMLPPNLGPDYASQFREMFQDLAEENDATLIPFLLERVAGRPELNLSDGIHPTPEGHEIVAETVWKYLQPMLEK